MIEDETADMAFKEWCQVQIKNNGESEVRLSNLLDDFGNRVVLFDNRTKDREKISRQVGELMENVTNLPSRHKLYTSEKFKEMEREKRRLIEEGGCPQLEESLQEKVHYVKEALAKLDLFNTGGGENVKFLK